MESKASTNQCPDLLLPLFQFLVILWWKIVLKSYDSCLWSTQDIYFGKFMLLFSLILNSFPDFQRFKLWYFLNWRLICAIWLCIGGCKIQIVFCDCCIVSKSNTFPMIPLCCTQAKCEQKESGSHTCTCPDGYAGDGTTCYGSLMDVSVQTSLI